MTIARDETGNGHDGTYGSGVIQGVPGLLVGDPNLAAAFVEGSGHHVTVPITSDLKFPDDDFSVEFWVKITGPVVGDNNIVGWASGGDRSWQIVLTTSGTPPVRFTGFRNDVDVVKTSVAAGTNVEFDTIHHVVTTYDATSDEMILYVDGVAVDSGTSSGTLNDGSLPIRLGGGSDNNEIDGVLDEVAIYDKVLTPSQINHHYQVGIGVK